MHWNEIFSTLSAFCALKQPLFLQDFLTQLSPLKQKYQNEVTLENLSQGRAEIVQAIRQTLSKSKPPVFEGECYPDQPAKAYIDLIQERFLQDLDRFFERKRYLQTLTFEEKRQLLFWMLLTRAVDDCGESLFFNGPLYKGAPFGGKGFKSTGQEAIVASVLRLKREKNETGYQGDIVGPMIRDLGVCLAMGMKISWVFCAQLGKNGPPMHGKDLHIGDFQQGIYPPTAPLAMTIQANVGIALTFKLRQEKRVVVNFSGDGATSLGEWHTAINFAAVQKLPIVFVVQDNQVALSTWKNSQCVADHYADKGPGYGIPSVIIDGNDPEAIFATVTEAAEYARSGNGPTLIELKTMRMSGHAFHDTSAYLIGRKQGGKVVEKPYVQPELYEKWKARDPILRYTEKLRQEGLTSDALESMKKEVEMLVNQGQQECLETPWPTEETVNLSVFAP